MSRMAVVVFLFCFGSVPNHPAEMPSWHISGVQTAKPLEVISPRLPVSSSHRTLLDVNEIAAWFNNDGTYYEYRFVSGGGFEWPKWGYVHAVFSSGLWLGAMVEGEVRVAVAGHFASEYRPGRILAAGIPEDPTQPHVRVYKVRPHADSPFGSAYQDWPVGRGAPWVDVDGDGVWNPLIDKPGLRFPLGSVIPDAMLYQVFNDADTAAHTHARGATRPLGVEVRKTVWAFETGFPDVHFIRYQIYNRSTAVLDDLHIAFWSDADLGYYADDMVGCDTTLDGRGRSHELAFVYNATNVDTSNPWIYQPPGYGASPPALGYKSLQGPLVVGTIQDTGEAFGRYWKGFRNVPLSSFVALCNPGWGNCFDPDPWVEWTPRQTYNILRGLRRFGFPYIDPTTGQSTRFVLGGDPASGTGWLPPPGGTDMQILPAVGPVTLAPQDSQEVTIAVFMARGVDHLNSVTRLRELSGTIRAAYDRAFKNMPIAMVSRYDTLAALLHVSASANGAVQITAHLVDRYGQSLATAELTDDGSGLFGNWIPVQADTQAVNLSLSIRYSDGDSLFWPRFVPNVALIHGAAEVTGLVVVSDNGNADLVPNPGEELLYTLAVRNTTSITLRMVTIAPIASLSPYLIIPHGQSKLLGTIPPSSTVTTPSPPLSFSVATEAPPYHRGGLVYAVRDANSHVWFDTIYVMVEPHRFPQLVAQPQHVEGNSEQRFGIRLIDHDQLKDEVYQISIHYVTPSGYEKQFSLINLTTNDTLLKRHDLPDVTGHNIPVTDGFRITRGSINDSLGARSWTFTTSGERWFGGAVPSEPFARLDIPEIGVGYPLRFSPLSGASSVRKDALAVVEIRFSDTETQRAYRYLRRVRMHLPAQPPVDTSFIPYVLQRGNGFPFQDYQMYPLGNSSLGRTVPFTVWEIDKRTGAERQLNVAILENNDTLWYPGGVYVGKGHIDGKWAPTVHPTGGYEILYILSSTYSEVEDTFYSMKNLYSQQGQFDIQYVFWPRRVSMTADYRDGDVLRIVPHFPLTERDVFVFNPRTLLKEALRPEQYVLHQNFPNPFNAGTTIRYELPAAGRVVVEVYNILGQRIRRLVDDEQDFGRYEVVWDGRSDAGKRVASGVYFYQLRAGSQAMVKKMMVLR